MQNSSTVTPVCPAGVQLTRHLVTSLWGNEVAKVLGGDATLVRREAMIRLHRASFKFMLAERFGWLSLAGILCGVPIGDLEQINPRSALLHFRSSPSDLLGEPWGSLESVEEKSVQISGTSIMAPESTDPFGFGVAALAASCIGRSVVRINGRALSSPSVTSALRARLLLMRESDG